MTPCFTIHRKNLTLSLRFFRNGPKKRFDHLKEKMETTKGSNITMIMHA